MISIVETNYQVPSISLTNGELLKEGTPPICHILQSIRLKDVTPSQTFTNLFLQSLHPPKKISLNPTPAVVRWQRIPWPQCIQRMHRWFEMMVTSWPVACHGLLSSETSAPRSVAKVYSPRDWELHRIFLLICAWNVLCCYLELFWSGNHGNLLQNIINITTSTKSGIFLLTGWEPNSKRCNDES